MRGGAEGDGEAGEYVKRDGEEDDKERCGDGSDWDTEDKEGEFGEGLQGASCTTGGLFRGKAVGNAFKMADFGKTCSYLSSIYFSKLCRI